MTDLTVEGMEYEDKIRELKLLAGASTNNLNKIIKLSKKRGWRFFGDPNEGIKKIISKLESEDLIKNDGKKYILTEKGKKQLKSYEKSIMM